MSSYTEKIVRLRHHEDVEEGQESPGGSGDEKQRSHHRRSKSSKKHHHKKHHKKEKKKKRRHESDSPPRKVSRRSTLEEEEEEEENADDTEEEVNQGASTPEVIDVDAIEDGEIEGDSPEPETRAPAKKRRFEEEEVEEVVSRVVSRKRSRSPRDRRPRRIPSPPSTNKFQQPQKQQPEEESFKESLSIEQTNKLREKLGLKPLNTEKGPPPPKSDAPLSSEFSQYEVIPSSLKNERHRPPENLGEVSRTERIRRRIQERREKRKQESKLLLVRGLGDSDGESEKTSHWVKKQEALVKEKEAAAKRAKILDELDDDFGVGAILKEEEEEGGGQDKCGYGAKDLQGLTVEHSLNDFSEGRSVILTLKDADILDESEGDALINVNMLDDEKAQKRIEDTKKAKVGYNPYDQESIDEATGELKKKNLLDKYDEEIDGEVKKSFSLGSEGRAEDKREKERIRDRLNKNRVSLELPDKKVASDYYTPSEVVAFKKSKKSSKKKVKRRMLKADDLINMMTEGPSESFGSRAPKEIEDQDMGEIQDLSKVDVCKEEVSEAEKLRLKIKEKLQKKKAAKPDIGDLLLRQKEEDPPMESEAFTSSGAELIGTFADDEINSKNIILNETSEFCRNLGAWTTAHLGPSQAANSSHSILDEFEDSLKRGSKDYRMDSSCEEEIELDGDDVEYAGGKKKDTLESVTILDEEPNLNHGVGSAIQMAVTKGYWESDVKKKSGSNLKHLMSQNYFIDDKVRDDDRSSRRHQDRYGSGPTVSFQEKKDYNPRINLEYIDDSGRKLNSKEAFRYLSHRFHGKGSGKLKTEKRMKKSVEESMMKNMSSTDTPLGTVEKMVKKQKETSTPYLVISGKNQHPELRK
eukprot:TRINITY_DN2385_c0_g1_i1.p1 TRINITY_DN2385_c0_g1~~TRINITY_DN2385_c0_g1_i1.p1  ORF type:complete len:865 (+),score=360.53 TRINITY_DN2385_c0_g1_i1:3-2597(+)